MKTIKKGAQKAPPMTEIIERFAVSGLKYHDYQLVPGLRAGRACTLFHERYNAYDANAIRIDVDGVKVGYVPRELTSKLHAYRKQHIKLFPFVASVNEGNPSSDLLYVKVLAERTLPVPDEFAGF